MAQFDFRLPDIGEGIAEAEIVAWHVKVGDQVEEDAPLADMMTDKATVEMTAPVSGQVTALCGGVGDQVAIGAVLVTFEVGPKAKVTTPPLPASAGSYDGPADQTMAAPEAPSARPQVAAANSAWPAQDAAGSLMKASIPEWRHEQRILASPAVRARAAALGIDLKAVAVAGERIRHSDLDAFLQYNADRGYSIPASARIDEQVKVFGLRRRIADNMSESKRHIPHFTYVEEANVTKLEAMRLELNGERGGKGRLTILPFLVSAICKALREFPMLNARYDDSQGVIHRSGAVHMGIATQTDNGLLVPVLRDADRKNLWQISEQVKELAEKARHGRAKSEELSGSTLTITSLGALGGVFCTPVINRPEVAIIAPSAVIEKPIFQEDRVVAAKVLNLSISCDHRVVDGWDAASFVREVKRLVEAPALLFAQ